MMETPKKLQATLEYKINALLGEGPIWNQQTSELYWVDIDGKLLNIYNPETKINRGLPVPLRIGTVVPSGPNEAIIALEDGMYKIDIQTGEVSLFSTLEADISENRFNDGKCDPAGRLWVGSMKLENTGMPANLYMIDHDGTATIKIENVSISNGIIWSLDQKKMYYVDSPNRKVRAFDFNITNGNISNERVLVELSEADGFPDGIAIDEEDMLWVALWGGYAVARFNTQTGELMQKIDVPVKNVTACAFGGENLDILYITTASVETTDEELANFPDAGSIFSVRPGVKGIKSSFFEKKIESALLIISTVITS
jgi:sugar lactone lactonase YvrE